MTTRHPTFADDVRATLAELGASPIDIPILQPADPFLDMAGEDLRRRIFLTESETGQAMCLRPEFTIPVCLDHIATKAGTPRRYGYLGEVFRQRREGGSEFLQAGIEDLGESDISRADARSIADAHALLSGLLPRAAFHVTIGDQRVFEAVLAALGLPRGWQKRLVRAFGSRPMLEVALADLANPSRKLTLDEPAASLVAAGDETGLTAHVAAAMEEGGLSQTDSRSAAEIARRLVEKAELRSVRLSQEAIEALRAFLAIRAPLRQAGNALRSFAGDAGISLGVALDLFLARARCISELGLPENEIVYDAAFGRPLDYYTGLVYEITAGKGMPPLAGGGRYDRLLTLLGATSTIPGVGFSVWLDRVEALKGAGE